jgi:hypothetical protein
MERKIKESIDILEVSFLSSKRVFLGKVTMDWNPPDSYENPSIRRDPKPLSKIEKPRLW